MTMIAQEWLLTLLLVFCRIGGCFLLLPGISSERIPPQVRLFLSLAVSISICPLVLDDLRPELSTNAGVLLPLVGSETVMGLLLGFLIRIFFLALDFAAVAAANYIGYGSVFAHSIETSDSAPPLSMIMTLSATTLFFVLDQHLRMIELLEGSYVTFPPARAFNLEPTLRTLVAALGAAFRLALQVSAPLLVFSLTVNWFLGLLNKMVPQIQIYYVSTPFLLFGGLFVLYFSAGDIFLNFGTNVAANVSGLLARD